MASFGHFMGFFLLHIFALSVTFCYFVEIFHLLTLFPLFFNTFKHFFAPSGTFPPHFLANGWIFKLIFHTLLPLLFFFSFWKRPEIKNMAHLIFIFIFVGPICTILDQFGDKFHPFRPLWTIFFYHVEAIWKYLEPFWAIWSLLELFGDIWSCLEPSVVIWSHLEPFGADWSHLEPFEAIWSHFELFGVTLIHLASFLSHFEPFHAFSSYFEPFGSVLTHSDPVVPIRTHLEPFWAILRHLNPFGLILTHLVWSGLVVTKKIWNLIKNKKKNFWPIWTLYGLYEQWPLSVRTWFTSGG